MLSAQVTEEAELSPSEPPSTEAITVVEDLRECSPLSWSLCSHLPYNVTSYPNLVGHSSSDALQKDLVAFRELLDAECSVLAQVNC